MYKTLISELVCTRINHDIIGNVGAVANAVELLEDGDMDFLEDITKILKTSSKVMSARLKFFRLAFGLGNEGLNNVETVVAVIKDYVATIGSKNYPAEFETSLQDGAFSKITMLCAMAVGDVLVKGGKITVLQEGNQVVAIGAGPSFSSEKLNMYKDIIKEKDVEIQAQYAHVFYLREILKQNGFIMDILTDDGIKILIAGG